MKKFLSKLSVFFLYAFLLQVVFPVAVDPFHVFRPESMKNTGITPNSNYVKMKYILNHPEKFDSFIFGSSRVGGLHPEKMPGRTYNMTYPAGLPAENLLSIKTFFENNIRPKKIYVGVDSLSYTYPIEMQINQPGRCPYEYLNDSPEYFYSMYLNPMSTFRALWLMFTELELKIDKDMFYSIGSNKDYNYSTKYIWPKDDKEVLITLGRDNRMQQTLSSIKEIVNICLENGTEIIVFTNPMHRITYAASIKKKYFDFLEALSEVTDFWNFSSLNAITLDNDNYIDDSHYRAEVGDIMIDIMCSGKSYPELQAQGFGVKVTRENAKDFISMLRKQFEDYETSHK